MGGQWNVVFVYKNYSDLFGKMQFDYTNNTCYINNFGQQRPFFNRNLDTILNGSPGKMFVGGLNQDTTADTLNFYFSQFGKVEECVIMKDTKTGLSRGFGFVTFFESSSIQKVLDIKEHILDGRKIDPQHATRQISPARSVHNIFKKIFVGGVPQCTTAEELKAYFNTNFGPVEDLVLKVDYPKNNHRGFGFLTFEDPTVADCVVAQRYHQINGKIVETKPAQKKEFVNLNPIVTHDLTNLRCPNDSFFSLSGLCESMDNCVFTDTSSIFSLSSLSEQPKYFFNEESSFRKKLAKKYLVD